MHSPTHPSPNSDESKCQKRDDLLYIIDSSIIGPKLSTGNNLSQQRNSDEGTLADGNIEDLIGTNGWSGASVNMGCVDDAAVWLMNRSNPLGYVKLNPLDRWLKPITSTLSHTHTHSLTHSLAHPLTHSNVHTLHEHFIWIVIDDKRGSPRHFSKKIFIWKLSGIITASLIPGKLINFATNYNLWLFLIFENISNFISSFIPFNSRR